VNVTGNSHLCFDKKYLYFHIFSVDFDQFDNKMFDEGIVFFVWSLKVFFSIHERGTIMITAMESRTVATTLGVREALF